MRDVRRGCIGIYCLVYCYEFRDFRFLDGKVGGSELEKEFSRRIGEMESFL